MLEIFLLVYSELNCILTGRYEIFKNHHPIFVDLYHVMLPWIKARNCVYHVSVVTCCWHGNGLIVDVTVVTIDSVEDKVFAVYVSDGPLELDCGFARDYGYRAIGAVQMINLKFS